MSGVIRSIPGPTIRSCQERRDVSVMGVSFRVVLSFRFRVEGPFAAPLPEREGVAIALRAGGQIEHRAIERRSEEHTSELQSLMRNSYAVFCLKKKNKLTHESNSRVGINVSSIHKRSV